MLGAAATVIGDPGLGIPEEDLTLSGEAFADLGNGANGPVSIVVNACNPEEPFCSDGTQVELTGEPEGCGRRDTALRLRSGVSRFASCGT